MAVSIQTRNLVKRYGKRTVVDHVSFDVKQGEIVGLLGPNGAGKTTSFYQVVGLLKPDEGQVLMNDADITKLPMYKRAKMGIGYLPQEASVFRKLSVEDNISAVLEMTDLSKADQRAKLESLLNEFRLQHVRKSNGDVLSGGERRRTEIARALAVDPKFILLDEPFAGIDPIAVEDIQAIVAKLKYKNIGILITDHNVTETLSICDRAYLLIEGKIYKHGTAEELASDEQVRKLYLGRNFELKRKDYLHEEARDSQNAAMEGTPGQSIKPEKMAYSLESGVTIVERMLKLPLSPVNVQDLAGLGFTDLCKFLPELKKALEEYAKTQESKKLTQLISQIPELEPGDYKPSFFLSLFTMFGQAGGYAAYLSVVKKMNNDLGELSGILNRILFLVKNPEFEEVVDSN